jgi:hypothetical protein
MSSVGQGVGMVVGGAIGFFAGGNVALGASIGGAIGGYIDPPKGPKIEGPRLADTKQQTATYGAFITRTYANVDASGNVFWIENNALRETSTTESQGGKGGGGGGGAETTTYSYSGTFALGLCACDIGEIKQLGRIWIRGKLWHDPISADAGATMASAEAAQYFTFHNGADDQAVDVRMQATLGINNVPAYRGLCYIVFSDLPLEDYANSIVGTQIKVEILSAAVQSDPQLISTASSTSGQMVYDTGVSSIGGTDVQASAFYFNNSWNVATEKTRLDYRESGMFSPSIMETSPLSTMINSSRPGKYPWLTAPLYHIGDNSGVSYAGNEYPMPISVAPSGIHDWCIDELGQCFLLYDDDTLYSATPWLEGQSIELPGARTMYLMGDLFYVFADGYTYVVDKFMTLLGTLANTLDLAWGPGDAYTWQAFGGNDGRVWLMECYGVGNGSVARLNASATAIEEQFAIAEASTDGGRAAIYVSNGILMRAYVDGTNDKFTVEKWLLKTLELQTVPLSEIVSRECLRSGLLDASDIDVTALTQEVRGYKISNIGSIRSALEPLQACWPFDVVPSGYKIKFVPRGGASVATIDSLELDAREGNSGSGVQITHAREMATQLPRRVEVTYLDSAREYDIGPPGLAERLNTDATAVEKIELPIVLNANEAQGKAETLLYLRWLERHDLSFIMPPSRLNLETPDVVTVTAPGATYVCRIAETTTLPDGRIEVRAKLASTTIYTPPAVGQAGLSTGQVLTWAGPSEAELLDIPCVLDSMDQAGFTVAMNGTSSGWPGGVLVRSDDGQNWTTVLGFSKPGSTLGFVYGAIGAGRTDIPDTANVLQAYFTSGDPTSVTESALDGGANMFAYGADQRWEIVSIKTVSDRSDGGKDMFNLLRGRFGTEWAMTLHEDGDALILLDLNAQQFVAQNLDNIGQTRTYRAVTQGKEIATASDQSFTYRGMNLECLAPCYLNGHRDIGNLNWTLTWTRRGRIGTNWRDYVDVPLGESSESYEVEIWNDSDYATLKRTITATSPTITYTQAQQITDFGDDAETLFVRVYQLSTNVGRGMPLQASISRGVSALTDPLWNYVASLLHFNLDYEPTSTTFTDTKAAKSATVNGDAKITTANKKYGSASGYLDGTGDSISYAASADFDFGTGDFCIETWVNSPLSQQGTLWDQYDGANAYDTLIYILTTGVIRWYYGWSGTGLYFESDVGSAISANTWAHVACRRSGTELAIYINGVKQSTTFTKSTQIGSASRSPYIGQRQSGSNYYLGYIDDFKITKGAARYTGASFTPPGEVSSSDADWASCVLCLPMNTVINSTVFYDQKGKVWTRSGSPTISATQSLYGGYSGSFGSGQYIYTPSHADFQVGSGNFCMEANVYWTVTPGGSTNPCALFRKWSASAGNYQFSADIYYEGGGNFSMRFSYSTTGSDAVLKTVAISVPSSGAWITYRWDRNGNTLRFQINGATVGSFDMTGVTIYSGTADMAIGLHGSSGATGYLEEGRFTKESRSNGDYVVVAQPFPNE